MTLASPHTPAPDDAASAPRESLRERLNLKYWTFRALAAITPLAPLWLAQRLAVAGGALTWLLAASMRRRAERNLAHIPALAADPARLRRAARGVFSTLALNYLDFFRGRFVTYEELARGWEIKDWELFERAMRSGRGVIVLGIHLGPFEYSAWKLGELGYSLLTPAERLSPERLNTLVTRLRNHHEARLLPGDDRETLRELLNSLRRGQMAMFAIDRWVLGPSDAWPLFGAPARLPTAPFALAARSEAPVFLLTSWRIGLKRFQGAVELITPERLPPDDAPPAEGHARTEAQTDGQQAGQQASQRASGRAAAIAQMRQRVYTLVERCISAHPEQWVSALSPVWEFPAQMTQSSLATPAGDAGSSAAARHAGDGEQPAPQTATATATAREAATIRAGQNR